MNTSSLIYLVYCPDMDGYIVLANRGKYSVTRPFAHVVQVQVRGTWLRFDPRPQAGVVRVVWSFGRLVVGLPGLF